MFVRAELYGLEEQAMPLHFNAFWSDSFNNRGVKIIDTDVYRFATKTAVFRANVSMLMCFAASTSDPRTNPGSQRDNFGGFVTNFALLHVLYQLYMYQQTHQRRES